MFRAVSSSHDMKLTRIQGPSRDCGRFCHEQSYGPRVCPLHRETSRRIAWTLFPAAKALLSTRRTRSGLGGTVLHSLRLRQRTQTDQACQSGKFRDSLVEPCGQLLQALLSIVSSGYSGHGDQLVHLPTRCVPNSEEFGRLLAIHDQSKPKPLLDRCHRRSALCNSNDLDIQPR